MRHTNTHMHTVNKEECLKGAANLEFVRAVRCGNVSSLSQLLTFFSLLTLRYFCGSLDPED